MATIRGYDPRGFARVAGAQLAPRPTSIEGLRPGVLENRKANARLLLETMVEALGERVPLGNVTVGSKAVAGPATSSTIELLKKECDFVLVGSSD
jgi:hypothetical protein